MEDFFSSFKAAFTDTFKIVDETGSAVKGPGSFSQNKELIRRFLPFLRGYWGLVTKTSLMMIISLAAIIPQPWIMKFIIDDVIPQKSFKFLLLSGGGLLVLVLIEKTSLLLKGYFAYRYETGVKYQVRSQLLARMLRLPRSYFDNRLVGYLMSRITNDVRDLNAVLSETMLDIVANVLMVVGGLIILSSMHWKLTLLSFAVVPVLIFVTNLVKHRVWMLSHRSMETDAMVACRLQECFSGISFIKSTATEKTSLAKVDESLREERKASLQQAIVSSVAQLSVGSVISLAGVMVIWYGASEVIHDRLSLGELVAFKGYLNFLYGPTTFLVNIRIHIQSGFSALERILSLFDIIPEDEDDWQKGEIGVLSGRIEFDQVSFEYVHGEAVLNEVSFVVDPGERVVVVGPTGAGKSTLISLILRLYNPTKGRIFFDNVDSRELAVSSLRSKIALMAQKTFLFDDTIEKNIGHCKPGAPFCEIESAAKKAGAHDFIIKLEHGYQTKLGENGVRLSVGEQQRLSLARSLLGDYAIVIFDEPTSSVDTLMESKLVQIIMSNEIKRTTIVVTHRLSLAQKADRILVMEKGSIVQEGTHRELSEQTGLYQLLLREHTPGACT